MKPLLSLVYVSSADSALGTTQIENLLLHARQRNKENDVSGMLLHGGGNFMQYLEGSPDKVNFIYKIIVADKQHYDIIEMIREPITTREFGGWSMAYHSPVKNAHVGSSANRAMIELGLDQARSDLSDGRVLLQGFWNRISNKDTL